VPKDVLTLTKQGAHIIIATPGRLLDLMDRQLNSGLPQAVKSLVSKNKTICVKLYNLMMKKNRNFLCLTKLIDF